MQTYDDLLNAVGLQLTYRTQEEWDRAVPEYRTFHRRRAADLIPVIQAFDLKHFRDALLSHDALAAATNELVRITNSPSGQVNWTGDIIEAAINNADFETYEEFANGGFKE